jgi:NAD(P)-dependent dehydrogenase (short-subunit alcohol dehydrogenase family)
VSVFSPFEERTFEEIDFVMDVNIKGNILLTQNAFNRFFKVQKSGAIINIGSIYGVVAGDMQIYNEGDRRTPEIYGATKAAVINLTKYFAAYMAPFSVRANCISPGGIFNNQNKDFVEKYSAKVPLKRMAKCEEMLSTLDYLMSDDSSYVTGQNILVDGGLTSL